MHGVLIDLLIFTAAAIVFVPLFRWLNIGAILAYLFAGLLIGPHSFGFIHNPSVILSFSELGVVFLLFLIGLELAPEKLWRLRHSIFGLGLLQVLLTGAVFTAIGLALDLPFAFSYIAGFGLALSSTAFSVQIMEENRQLKTAHGQGEFSILMLQDLAVVPLLLSLAFFTDQGYQPISPFLILKFVGLLVGLFIVGRYVIRHILRWIADTHTHEVFTALTLFIVIGTAVLMESVGLSMGLGAFLAGVVLANSEYRHELEINLQPFKGLLLGLFFMAVGMSLDIGVLIEKPLQIILLTLSFMTLKIFIVYFLSRYLFRYSGESARNMAFILPQGGEFAFVLFNTAGAKQLLDIAAVSQLNAAVTLSMALTPLLFFLNQRFFRTMSEISEKPYDQIQPEGAEVLIAGFGRFGQIVGRLLRAEGVPITILENDVGQIEGARKFGHKVFYGDASRRDLLESAGAKTAKYIVIAIDDMASSLETVKVVKSAFPHLQIFARARNRRHAIELMDLGVTQIHRETFLTSLQVAKEVLLAKGKSKEEVLRKIEKFRNHDEEVLRNQYKLKDDEAVFVSYSVQANKDLEEVLRSDRL